MSKKAATKLDPKVVNQVARSAKGQARQALKEAEHPKPLLKVEPGEVGAVPVELSNALPDGAVGDVISESEANQFFEYMRATAREKTNQDVDHLLPTVLAKISLMKRKHKRRIYEAARHMDEAYGLIAKVRAKYKMNSATEHALWLVLICVPDEVCAQAALDDK